MCWAVNVVSRVGCPIGAFVSVDSYDANGRVVDQEIAPTTAGYLAPNQVGLAKGGAVVHSAVSFKVVEMECTK